MSQTGFCPKKQTETGRFDPVSVFFFKKKFGLVTFFDKNRTEPKIMTLISDHLFAKTLSSHGLCNSQLNLIYISDTSN
jgi:hypothetical protein